MQLLRLRTATTRAEVADLLGFRLTKLNYLVFKRANKYTEFTVTKKSGGERVIQAPCSELKLAQSRLSKLLQDCLDEIIASKNLKGADSLSHGFRRDRSILTNAAQHKSRRFVLNLDLADFFPSINLYRVRGYFIANDDFLLHRDVATYLAQIACYDAKLPQGSPCSPVISNLITHILDISLARLASQSNATYSRYADDLTFSTNMPEISSDLAVFTDDGKWVVGKKLEKAISKNGFTINSIKTRNQYKHSRQEVTGVVVNKKLNVKAEYWRATRSMCHSLFKFGHYSLSGEDGTFTNNIEMLRGRLAHIDMFDAYNSSLSKSKGDKGFNGKHLNSRETTYQNFLRFTKFYNNEYPLIICEGETDNIYLKAAIESFGGAFPQLIAGAGTDKKFHIRFFNYNATAARLLDLSGGGGELQKFIFTYSTNRAKKNKNIFPAARFEKPVIILVDNDSGSNEIFAAAKKVAGIKEYPHDQPYLRIEKNLYLVPIPKIGGKDTYIEMLFPEKLRQIKVAGKSFNPSNKKIDGATEYGKQVFAEQIVRKNKASVDFSGFKGILAAIATIVDTYRASE